jgi:branched-chain amino acid transport system ATP-binding protein
VSLLEVDDLRATYGQGHVLHGISFTVDEGQIVSILGPNGAGKTTTLRAISGLVETSGRIALDGAEIQGESPDRIARRGIAHVPEGRGTFTELSVEDNLLVGGYTRKSGVHEDVARCYEWFPRLGERRTQHAGTLSGGEQQMLAVARALMARPTMLLIDEPCLGLSPKMVGRLGEVIRQVNAAGISILLVEQNTAFVFGITQYTYVIENGQIVLQGTPAELRQNDMVRTAYLGI